MLIEMVSLSLAVFSGITPLSGVFTESTIQHSSTTVLSENTIHYEVSSSDGLILEDSSAVQDGLIVEIAGKALDETPTPALESDLSEEAIVAMLKEATPIPSDTPTPTPTTAPTATPTPTVAPLPTETPTPTPPPAVAAPVDLEGLFQRFSDEYKVDKEQMKRIAKCESGFNSEATNGDYTGMFQYAASSWSSMRAHMGADTNPDLRRNPEEAIRTAAYHISTSGTNAWPSCD